jgi:hypothetical protein
MKGKSMGWFGLLASVFIAAGASLYGLGDVGFWGMLIIMMLPQAGLAICKALRKRQKHQIA